MESPDIVRRLLQHRPQFRFQIRQSLLQLGGGDLDLLRLRVIQLLCIPPEGGVAVLPHVRQNGRDRTGHVPFILCAGQNL